MLETLDTQCNRKGIAGEYKDNKSDDMNLRIYELSCSGKERMVRHFEHKGQLKKLK